MSERGVHHRRAYHSLPGRFSGRYCRIPHFRSDGYPCRRYRLCSRTLRTGYEFCRRSAHRIDEIAQRKRRQWANDRYDERIRTGLFRFTGQLRCARSFGHYILYPGCVFWQCRNNQNAQCGYLWADRRFLGNYRRHTNQLFILLLIYQYHGCNLSDRGRKNAWH